MSVVEGLEASLAAKFSVVFPHLDERQRRLVLGAEARAIGHGGIPLVARAAGVGVVTVSRTSTPSTARFPTPADLIDFLTNTTETGLEIKPAC